MAGGTTWTLHMIVTLTLLTRNGLLCHPRISSASTDNWSHPFLHLRKSLTRILFHLFRFSFCAQHLLTCLKKNPFPTVSLEITLRGEISLLSSPPGSRPKTELGSYAPPSSASTCSTYLPPPHSAATGSRGTGLSRLLALCTACTVGRK